MVGLAFSIAASCNFPIILLSMYWRGLTTRVAVTGGWLGLLTAMVLMIPGPTIWIQVLGHNKPVYPYEYPVLFSMLVAFVCCWLFSVTDYSVAGRSEREHFIAQFIRTQTGIGIDKGENTLNKAPQTGLRGRRLRSLPRHLSKGHRPVRYSYCHLYYSAQHTDNRPAGSA